MTSTIVFIGLALVFALGKVILEMRLAYLDVAGDERRLCELAFSMGCSVYDLFTKAAEAWNFSKAKIDADFKTYITQDRIPSYLKDFLSENTHNGDFTYQKILFSGGRPPYL